MKTYVVTGGETPRDVTQKFTGSTNRVSELVASNPEWPRVVAAGTVGSPVTFDPTFWRDGVQVNIPEAWASNGSVGHPYGGTVSAGGTGQRACTVSPINEVKPYYLKVPNGHYAELIAKNWLGNAWSYGTGPHTTRFLLRANYDKVGGWLTDTEGHNCAPVQWNTGDIIKIPAVWPAPPTMYEKYIVNADGTKYEPTGNEVVEPDVPGDDGIDRINWFGDSESSGWVWPGLIVGAAALGGVLLVGATKKKGGSR